MLLLIYVLLSLSSTEREDPHIKSVHWSTFYFSDLVVGARIEQSALIECSFLASTAGGIDSMHEGCPSGLLFRLLYPGVFRAYQFSPSMCLGGLVILGIAAQVATASILISRMHSVVACSTSEEAQGRVTATASTICSVQSAFSLWNMLYWLNPCIIVSCYYSPIPSLGHLFNTASFVYAADGQVGLTILALTLSVCLSTGNVLLVPVCIRLLRRGVRRGVCVTRFAVGDESTTQQQKKHRELILSTSLCTALLAYLNRGSLSSLSLEKVYNGLHTALEVIRRTSVLDGGTGTGVQVEAEILTGWVLTRLQSMLYSLSTLTTPALDNAWNEHKANYVPSVGLQWYDLNMRSVYTLYTLYTPYTLYTF